MNLLRQGGNGYNIALFLTNFYIIFQQCSCAPNPGPLDIGDIVDDAKDFIKDKIIDLPVLHFFKTNELNKLEKKALCKVCKESAGSILENYYEGDADRDLIMAALVYVCKPTQDDDKVCEGIVNVNIDTIMFIMDQRKITDNEFCGTVLENMGCGDYKPVVTWSIDLKKYGPKPKCVKPARKEGSKPLTFLHITDLHYDPKYQVGLNDECGRPICCREGDGPTDDDAHKAGPFGDYHDCDNPLTTLESTLAHIAKTHLDIEYLYITGDFVSHDVGGTTRELVCDVITEQTKRIKDLLPGVKFAPSVGNHDLHATNVFASDKIKDPRFSPAWMYQLYIDQWTTYLPKDTHETIKKGGYYTFVTEKGLRIISLNSQHCYFLNYFLVLEANDPSGQLAWLAETLSVAEKENQPVHIIMHFPVGTPDCIMQYSQELWKILSRFSCNIRAVFVGHTHLLDWKVIYDKDDINIPIIPMINGGSITNFSEVNSNYNKYEIDPDSFELLNVEAWYFDLPSSKTAEPNWKILYSFKEEYDIPSLSPEDMDALVKKMATDITFMDKYVRNYSKGAETKLVTECDEECKKKRLCEIVTASYDDKRKCDQINEITTF